MLLVLSLSIIIFMYLSILPHTHASMCNLTPPYALVQAYVCDNQDVTTITRVGEVVHAASGRKMVVMSTEPVCQTYFSTLLQDTKGKDGIIYGTNVLSCTSLYLSLSLSLAPTFSIIS